MNKGGMCPQKTQQNVKARALFWDLGVYCLTLSFRQSTQFNSSGSFQDKGKKLSVLIRTTKLDY